MDADPLENELAELNEILEQKPVSLPQKKSVTLP
jgi:hypothetical protein